MENGEVEQLKKELEKERHKRRVVEEELREVKSKLEYAQTAAEQEEERITLLLMKKLTALKKERDEIAMQVEQEEEYLTNTLQQKLELVRREKIDLENKLEQEEELIVNKLQKKLADVIAEKNRLERRLEEESNEHLQLSNLEKEVLQLRNSITQYQLEKELHQKRNSELREQLQNLKMENFVLYQKVDRESERLHSISSQKLQLELDLELEHERDLNETRISPPLKKGMRTQRSVSNPMPLLGIRSSPPHHLTPQREGGPSPLSKVLKQDWIKVRKSQEDSWQRRCFVLFSSGELHDFRNPLEPKTVTNLDTVKQILELNDEAHMTLLKFVTKEGTRFLWFESQEQMKEWADLLLDLSPNVQRDLK